IMAAGFGSRFVPLTFETPKGLLEVFGERMIERQIKQLHDVGIYDIVIVVGYLKEHFDYLIDKYNVKLVYNPDYSTKNNISTLHYTAEYIKGSNVYILSSDNWMRENMYHRYEPYSWYSSIYMEGNTNEWVLKFNKKREITDIKVGGKDAYVMYGPVYFSKDFSNVFMPILEKAFFTPGSDDWYWENVLMNEIKAENKDLPAMHINPQPENQVYEFENLEELRAFDDRYKENSGNVALELIAKVFDIPQSHIKGLRTLKAGMTNKSFLFEVDNQSYICRIPGKGTDVLIDRKNEYDSYMAVKDLHITERIIYFDRESGYKISKFYDGSRNADPKNKEEMDRCMELLKSLHDKNIQVDHSFDIAERIEYYTKLCNESGGISFEDVSFVQNNMKILLDVLDQMKSHKCLCHIDSVADNFIITADDRIKLIDWEYAGMAEPIIDVAMCSIYSYYDKEKANTLLESYLQRKPTNDEYKKLYAYMALSGYLWSLWTVYKSNIGEEFGEYSLKMYRYAKDFFVEAMRD
ncbi:MAG: phosphotransferase, partial [Lachnoanaerobaculum sp.]|nr:phosphotransferase [Lachnoanaerobaculum sp.]